MIDFVETERNRIRYQAQSLLTGIGFRDGTSNCPTLTLDQAYDVLNWAKKTLVT